MVKIYNKIKVSEKQKQFKPGVAQLRRLLKPTSIAIIGATDAPGKTGAMITENLVRGGFAGRVVCVNPHRESVFGVPCYASLDDAPDGRVDCAIVVVPAVAVEDVIRASVGLCKNFVVIAAGFGESGEDGRAREAALAHLAQEYRLAILGPNCLGFLTPGTKTNASFAPHVLVDGNVALLSQSGALAVALLDVAAQTQQGFSLVVSLGNKMQIDESLLMAFLAQDSDTDVIALYIEDVVDGRRFVEQVRAIVPTKPVVVLRGGTTDAGHAASASHTGALTQASDVFDAVCRKYGVVQVESVEQFVDVIAFVRRYGTRFPQRFAVVTNAGGLGVLTADACECAGVPLVALPSHLQSALAQSLPPAASTINPIDILGDADVTRYKDVFTILAKERHVDTVVAILTPQAQTPVMAVAREIARQAEQSDLMYIAVFVGGARVDDARRFLVRNGVPSVVMPQHAVAVLGALFGADTQRYSNSTMQPVAQHVAAGTRIYGRVRDEARGALYYSEVMQMAQRYSLPVIPAWRMDYDSPSSVQFPCVVKVDAPTVLHKTDRGGVIVGVRDGAQLNSAIETLQQRFHGERIIVQPMVDAGMELIIGAKRDAIFGPTVLVGYGGIYAENIAMTQLAVPPFDAQDVQAQLLRSRLGFLFRETRGQAPYDSNAVAQIMAALGAMMLENTWIDAVDINPLFIYNDGKSAQIVDMKIIVKTQNI